MNSDGSQLICFELWIVVCYFVQIRSENNIIFPGKEADESHPF